MTDFTRLLWRALWDEGLVTVPELYGPCQKVVQERAHAERAFLVARLGETTWEGVLAAWGQPDAERLAATQLGFGAVLTEFFVAPVSLPDAVRLAVAHLGTLVNLLVGVYDDLVDTGIPEDPLPRQALQSLLLGKGAPLKEAQPLVALADEYFRQLAALAGADARPEVLRTLRRAIVKMYTAERATLDGGGCAGKLAGWQRKSTLPFVVMALPAWLATPDLDPHAYRRHLRWLCRCGEFWGWVDDAVDLTDDTAAGHPNRVEVALKKDATSAVAAHIAALGRNVLADWRRMTPQAVGLPITVQEAFPMCLFSTLGQTLSRTRKEVNA